LQKCDPEAGPKLTPLQRKDWYVVHQLYKDVQTKVAKQKLDCIDFMQVENLKCVDPIHTTDDSAQIIAEIYGAHILRRYPEITKNGQLGTFNLAGSRP